MGREWNSGYQCLRTLLMKVDSASAHCDYERSDWGYVWINKVEKQFKGVEMYQNVILDLQTCLGQNMHMHRPKVSLHVPHLN